MGRTLEMFDKPRRPRQWLMHVFDAGDGPCCCDETPISVRYECQRCGHQTEWTGARTVTEAKRGVPCPECNAATDMMGPNTAGNRQDAAGGLCFV